MENNIILGIDPGTNIMGYGLINIVDKKTPSLICMGVVKLKEFNNHALKLRNIFERTLALIDTYSPDQLAIEAPFYGKNVQSMLKLGRAQGVSMAAALYRDIPIFEYTPREIKKSICGNGSASKEQVAGMLGSLITIPKKNHLLDATDAVGVALCHHFKTGNIRSDKNYSGWKSFVKKNPDRVS